MNPNPNQKMWAGVLLAIGHADDRAAATTGEVDAIALYLGLELAGEQLGDLGTRQRRSLDDARKRESGGANDGGRESGAKDHSESP